jgi:acetate kinase
VSAATTTLRPPTRAPQQARADAVLTINSGSSSVKFGLFDATTLDAVASGQIDALGDAPGVRVRLAAGGDELRHRWPVGEGPADHAEALRWLLDWIAGNAGGWHVAAVGHRIVHGGLLHAQPVRLDDAIVDELAALVPLAPLHQPHNLAGVRAARSAFGDVPQVACFDTAFHRRHDFVEDCFALPRWLYEAGVRRYGFHGLSYESIAGQLHAEEPGLAAGRVVVAHLGNGASMCALQAGRSVASTMGFTALDGLPMGTRCGQLDPGVLLYLIERMGFDAAALVELLYHRSGLLGLSGGLSNDMRTLEASAAAEALQAIDYFVHRIRRELGALTATLGGLDGVVFTGGIGENSVRMRERVLQGMDWLGIELDAARNAAGARLISADGSRVRVLRLRTDEERMIARHTSRVAQLGRAVA